MSQYFHEMSDMRYCDVWIFYGDIGILELNGIKLSTINIQFPYPYPLISKFVWNMNMSIRTSMDTFTGILGILYSLFGIYIGYKEMLVVHEWIEDYVNGWSEQLEKSRFSPCFYYESYGVLLTSHLQISRIL